MASVRVPECGGRDIPGVSEFCGSEVEQRTAPETTKRSEVGELVQHRGAVCCMNRQSAYCFHSKGLEHLENIEDEHPKGI